MDQIEELRRDNAVSSTVPAPVPLRVPAVSRTQLAVGALAFAAGAFALTRLRPGPAPVRGRVPAAFAPADRNLGNASPAVLGGSPKRQLYAGRNLARAVSIEDLRAMAHRRLP